MPLIREQEIAEKEFFSGLNQRGSIIVYALLTLVVISGISLTLVAIFLPKIRLASGPGNAVNAIFAADSGIEWCLFWQRGYSHPNAVVLSMDNGATTNVYWNWSSVASCDPSQTLNHQVVGSYRGVGRTFHITE